MKSFIVKLNPATQEELYSDISEGLLEMVLLEAVINVVSELPTEADNPHNLDASGLLPDSEGNVAVSAEWLVGAMIEFDRAQGVEYDSGRTAQYHQMIEAKIHQAMESVNTANSPCDLAVIDKTLRLPEFVMQMSYVTRHLGNQVMYLLDTPASMAL